MRTDRIHEIDLACISPLPTPLKWDALRKLKAFVPPYTYAPVRKTTLDILNIDPGPLALLQRTSWHHIESKIKLLSESDSEFRANLRAADALYRYSVDNEIEGVGFDFGRWSLGRGSVRYWSNAALRINGEVIIPFIDPRASSKLTPHGIQFVMSVMDFRIRKMYLDFMESRLAIIQFSSNSIGARDVEILHDNTVDIIPYAALKEMVRETYQIWRIILQERVVAERLKPRKLTHQMEFNLLPMADRKKAS